MSIRHLAPSGDTSQQKDVLPGHTQTDSTSLPSDETTNTNGGDGAAVDHLESSTIASEEDAIVPKDNANPTVSRDSVTPTVEAQPLRRSNRQRRAPDRL